MKATRILTAMFCAVALVALYGCGGSSQLSEYPLGDENLSTLTFGAHGYSGVRNRVDNGTSKADDGDHMCTFDVHPSGASLPDGDIEVVISPDTCTDPLNCAVCTVSAGSQAAGDCAIDCVVNALASSDLINEFIMVLYQDDILLWTTTYGLSGGALRIDGVAEGVGHTFDPESFAITEELPNTMTNPYCEGLVIMDDSAGNGCADPTTVPSLYIADATSTDHFTRVYNILNTIPDGDASSYFSSGILAGLLSDDDAWAHVMVEVSAEIDLSGLAVPNITESYDAGTFKTNAGFWHDSADQVETLLLL